MNADELKERSTTAGALISYNMQSSRLYCHDRVDPPLLSVTHLSLTDVNVDVGINE